MCVCVCVCVCVCMYMPAKPLQSCVTLCDLVEPIDHSLPGSSVHGILQARILRWVAYPPPGHLPNPRIKAAFLASPAWQAES